MDSKNRATDETTEAAEKSSVPSKRQANNRVHVGSRYGNYFLAESSKERRKVKPMRYLFIRVG